MPDSRAKDNRGGGAVFLGQPVRVTKAYEALASMIRERIVSGEFAEGDRIPSESTLAREAQVSRSTVREALRTLEQAGLIARASPKIMVVRAHDEGHARREFEGALRRQNVTFKHLQEALLLLEPELTRLATERARTSDIAELEANLSAQADSLDDAPTFNRLDQEFHLAIAEMSDNPALVMVRPARARFPSSDPRGDPDSRRGRRGPDGAQARQRPPDDLGSGRAQPGTADQRRRRRAGGRSRLDTAERPIVRQSVPCAHEVAA
jgi:DNA-binding GntR family transcriptional regulator